MTMLISSVGVEVVSANKIRKVVRYANGLIGVTAHSVFPVGMSIVAQYQNVENLDMGLISAG